MKIVLAILLVSVFVISLAVPTQAFKLLMVGDLSCSNTTLRNTMKTANPGLIVFLGDLCYNSSLSSFKSFYWNQFLFKNCVIGNHDAPEDGSSSIYTEAKNLCQETWRKKIENKTTVVIGINTNGNLNTDGSQAVKVLSWLQNATYMKNVKNTIFVTHKQAYTPPNSGHPVSEHPKVKTLLDFLASKTTTKDYFVAGHEHLMAWTSDKTKFVSGSGGRNHDDCTTSTTWVYCNESVYGFLQFTITPDGKIVPSFHNSNGVVIKQ